MKQRSSKLGHHTGSFINWIMSSNSSVPEVGMGATQMHWSDRDPWEVIEVSDDCKRVVIRAMDHEWDKTRGGGAGHQNWVITSNPKNVTKTLYWKWGAWRVKDQHWEYTEMYEADSDFNRECMTRDNYLLWMKHLYQNKAKYPQYYKWKTSWHIVRIYFGRAEYYYDLEF
jgi:hypothetical protein